MRRRALVGSVIASAGVLVAGFQIGAAANSATTTTTTGSTGATGSTGGSDTISGTAKDGTFTGTTIDTRFGAMQVQVVISGGKITDVKVLQATNREGRSVEISNRADPLLRSEVLQAQSANVSTIGGATYTSDGYLQSLQSALDQAGFTG
ncbi:MAG TPA: FMN-binding protein [Pseudolysinimonas sp.]